MTDTQNLPDLATEIGHHLPFLRRYARALTGSQQSGDNYAAATLEAMLTDATVFDRALAPKTALFRAFHQIWVSSGSPVDDASDPSTPEARAQWRLSHLTENTREVLLLHSIEGFTTTDIASIIGTSADEAQSLLTIARTEMTSAIHGRIMIIEDEAIIAMDIRAIVEEMGHAVTNVARTRDEAIQLARRDPPDLILADIQLADKSSGIDAVNHILKEMGELPIVFITAFPERLLTGDRPEPAFLITKPYTEEQVQSAVSQAMFFASTETLRA
ncbi:response regulator [Yoonia vestfoldensis]|jgi:CheY-like chemotaxis protein|uniref:Putative transcriptional regulatory protein pdtaR n=1 Tax=Yoonia vestfoldensis TaxID=245188 RepID=A0A1Y0EFY5_9RHOB|nr:response regulator [Yoonia vestfoldensis]ARU02319.1 putative transcriptional regulatory protein pdtaR [Yoonia vestfoldensis]